ncbi:MAG: hypothetical protein RL764_547 [Pseudomonadota bacterium]|jgi:hypothetical protein
MTLNTNAKTVSSKELADAALKVFTREEIPFLPERPFRDFLAAVARRLQKDGPPPTVDELIGLKELAFEHLWHPAIEAAKVDSVSWQNQDTEQEVLPEGCQPLFPPRENTLEDAPRYLAWAIGIGLRCQ